MFSEDLFGGGVSSGTQGYQLVRLRSGCRIVETERPVGGRRLRPNQVSTVSGRENPDFPTTVRAGRWPRDADGRVTVQCVQDTELPLARAGFDGGDVDVERAIGAAQALRRNLRPLAVQLAICLDNPSVLLRWEGDTTRDDTPESGHPGTR